MTEELPPAILLGGGLRIALSAARSLASIGVVVHAVGRRRATVRYSRFCHHFVDLGGGTDEATERWLSWLHHDGPRGAVVIPCSDEALELIANNRDPLVELGYRPVEANDEVVLAMLDKERSYELASRLGVPAPRALPVRSKDDAERAAEQIGFPCILKPIHSHRFARHYPGWTKLLMARNQRELVEDAAGALAAGLEMLAMEVIPGGDERIVTYWTYLDHDGEPVCHFTKRRIRQYPAQFGVGSYHVTEWDPEVAEMSLRFLKGAEARGIAAVEFKRDPRDEVPKLMECNHRLTGSIELGRASGLDFTVLAYRGALGASLAPDGFREGVRLWIPRFDLLAFLEYRSRGELTTGQWLRSLVHRQRLPVFRLSDPLPTLVPAAFHARRMLVRRVRPRKAANR